MADGQPILNVRVEDVKKVEGYLSSVEAGMKVVIGSLGLEEEPVRVSKAVEENVYRVILDAGKAQQSLISF